jgi:hypothetical protein
MALREALAGVSRFLRSCVPHRSFDRSPFIPKAVNLSIPRHGELGSTALTGWNAGPPVTPLPSNVRSFHGTFTLELQCGNRLVASRQCEEDTRACTTPAC